MRRAETTLESFSAAKEAVGVPSLEMLQARLDGALWSLVSDQEGGIPAHSMGGVGTG